MVTEISFVIYPAETFYFAELFVIPLDPIYIDRCQI